MKDSPLAHWSLAAVERINPGTLPALYRAAEDASDRLEVSEPEVVDAIDRILRAVGRGGPRSGRLRNALILVGLAIIGIFGVIWAPSAIRSQANAILPDAARTSLGRDVFDRVRRITGAPCPDPLGQQALDKLAATYAPGARVYVVPSGVETSATLPGDIILLGRSTVEDHETAFVVAGYLLEAELASSLRDPMLDLLESASLMETGRLMTTGRLADRALEAHAKSRVQSGRTPPDDTALVDRFATLNLPLQPYVHAREMDDDVSAGLLAAAREPVGPMSSPLQDDDWVALQGICGE